MSRFLFVVPPLTGHINPTVAVGAELTARGHEVAWAGQTATLRTLLAGRRSSRRRTAALTGSCPRNQAGARHRAVPRRCSTSGRTS